MAAPLPPQRRPSPTLPQTRTSPSPAFSPASVFMVTSAPLSTNPTAPLALLCRAWSLRMCFPFRTMQVSVLPRRLSSGVVRILRRGGGLGRVHIPDLLKWIAHPCPISHGYTPVSCALAGLLTRRARGPQELRPQWTKTSRTSSIFSSISARCAIWCA